MYHSYRVRQYVVASPTQCLDDDLATVYAYIFGVGTMYVHKRWQAYDGLLASTNVEHTSRRRIVLYFALVFTRYATHP